MGFWIQVHAFVRSQWMHNEDLCSSFHVIVFIFAVYKFHIKNCKQIIVLIIMPSEVLRGTLIKSVNLFWLESKIQNELMNGKREK